MKHLEKECRKEDEERRAKQARTEEVKPGEEGTSSSSSGGENFKGKEEASNEGWRASAAKSRRRAEEQRGQKREAEGEEAEMEVSLMERTMQEDMRWGEKEVSDMCMPENVDLLRWETDMRYYDQNTWEELETNKVVAREKAELERFRQMGVYDYIRREEAMEDPMASA